MRLARNARNLSAKERTIAELIFEDSLPRWDRIWITDARGPIPTYDNPFASESMGMFMLNLGPEMFPDATLHTHLPDYGKYRDIFVHELTHVWQYHRGYWVVLRSMWANCKFGAGYSYTLGDAWDDYNVEQQASIVEHWFVNGMKRTDPRFPYIDKIIRPGVGSGLADQAMISLPPSRYGELD